MEDLEMNFSLEEFWMKLGRLRKLKFKTYFFHCHHHHHHHYQRQQQQQQQLFSVLLWNLTLVFSKFQNLFIPKFILRSLAIPFNRPLASSKNPHFQNKATCTTFLVEMSFICRRMKNHSLSKVEHLTSF